MTKCGCRIEEDPDVLGYTYVMCEEHHDQLVAELERPPQVVPQILALAKKVSLRNKPL